MCPVCRRLRSSASPLAKGRNRGVVERTLNYQRRIDPLELSVLRLRDALFNNSQMVPYVAAHHVSDGADRHAFAIGFADALPWHEKYDGEPNAHR